MIKKSVGLEITSESIRAVELEKSPHGIILNAIAAIPTPAGCIKNGEIINKDLLSDTIAALFKKHNIYNKNIVLSLSCKGLIMQQMTMPDMPVSGMKEAVKSELEKYSLFSNHDIIFDYKSLSTFDEKGIKKTKVFLAGISSELMYSYINCLNKAGLSVSLVDIAPLSMISSEYARFKEDITSAFIQMKDDRVYVIVGRQGKFYLFYTADINPADTRALKEDEDFAHSKIALSFSALLKFYQKKFNSALERIILSYDDKKFPDLDKKASNYITGNIKVQQAQPLEHMKVYETEELKSILKEGISVFSACIGAGLRGLGRKGHDIGLDTIQRHIPKPAEARKRYIAAFIICSAIFLLSVLGYGYQKVLYDNLNNNLEAARQELAILDNKLARLYDLSKRHRHLKERLVKQSEYIRNLNSVSWSLLLEKVTRRMPEDLWLSKFKAADKGIVTLDGTSVSMDKVADFIRQLDAEEDFSDVDLDLLQQKKITDDVSGVGFRVSSGIIKNGEKNDESSSGK